MFFSWLGQKNYPPEAKTIRSSVDNTLRKCTLDAVIDQSKSMKIMQSFIQTIKIDQK